MPPKGGRLLRCRISPRSMAAKGQTRKSGRVTGQSALPSRTDIASRACQVRKVPQTDVASPSDTGRPSIISLTRLDCELAFFKLFAWSLAMGMLGDVLGRALEFLKSPAFDGLRSYTRFATSVQSELRFIRSKKFRRFFKRFLTAAKGEKSQSTGGPHFGAPG